MIGRTEGRWLRGVSGVMAVFCGGLAALLVFGVVILTASSAISEWWTRPVSWTFEGRAVAMSSTQTIVAFRSCRPGEPERCTRRDHPDAKTYASVMAGRAATQLPLIALAYGLFHACACFVGFARGRLLARRTVDRLVRFSVGGLAFVLTAPYAGTLGGVVTDGVRRLLDLASGDRSVLSSLSVYVVSYAGVSQLLTIVYAVTLTVIAVVMVKASAIADDHAQIV